MSDDDDEIKERGRGQPENSARLSGLSDTQLANGVGTRAQSGTSGRVSEPLEQMIATADRRLFPSLAALVLDFSRPDESARDLVPDEALDSVSFDDGLAPAMDPLEFTFLGAAPVQAASSEDREAGQGAPAFISSAPRTAQLSRSMSFAAHANTQVTAVDAQLLGRDSGSWNQSTLQKLAWDLDTHPGSFNLEVRTEEMPDSSATRVHELVITRGTVALEVSASAPSRPSPAEHLQAVERARASLTEKVRVLGQAEGTFVIRHLSLVPEPAIPTSVIPSSLIPSSAVPEGERSASKVGRQASTRTHFLAIVIEIARRSVSPAMAAASCGPGPVEITLAPSDQSRLERAGVEPEVLSLFSRGPIPVLTLLSDVPAKYGLPGLLVLLDTLGFARKLPPIETDRSLESNRRLGHAAIRDRVHTMATRARKASYFEVLELGVDASAREISLSSERLLLELKALNLPDHHLMGLRKQAIEGVHEASAVLSNPQLRDLYRAGKKA